MPGFNRDRGFESGADRSSDNGKPHFDRALSPLVMERFAEYMRDHNVAKGRREDQWQLGFPNESWISSAWRHFVAVWKLYRGLPVVDEKGNGVDIEDALCGLIFNVQGFLHQLLLRKLKNENPVAHKRYTRFIKSTVKGKP